MYAIKEKSTGRWVYTTNFTSYEQTYQICSDDKALLFGTKPEAEFQFKKRKCSASKYEIVEVELKEKVK